MRSRNPGSRACALSRQFCAASLSAPRSPRGRRCLAPAPARAARGRAAGRPHCAASSRSGGSSRRVDQPQPERRARRQRRVEEVDREVRRDAAVGEDDALQRARAPPAVLEPPQRHRRDEQREAQAHPRRDDRRAGRGRSASAAGVARAGVPSTSRSSVRRLGGAAVRLGAQLQVGDDRLAGRSARSSSRSNSNVPAPSSSRSSWRLVRRSAAAPAGPGSGPWSSSAGRRRALRGRGCARAGPARRSVLARRPVGGARTPQRSAKVSGGPSSAPGRRWMRSCSQAVSAGSAALPTSGPSRQMPKSLSPIARSARRISTTRPIASTSDRAARHRRRRTPRRRRHALSSDRPDRDHRRDQRRPPERGEQPERRPAPAVAREAEQRAEQRPRRDVGLEELEHERLLHGPAAELAGQPLDDLEAVGRAVAAGVLRGGEHRGGDRARRRAADALEPVAAREPEDRARVDDAARDAALHHDVAHEVRLRVLRTRRRRGSALMSGDASRAADDAARRSSGLRRAAAAPRAGAA